MGSVLCVSVQRNFLGHKGTTCGSSFRKQFFLQESTQKPGAPRVFQQRKIKLMRTRFACAALDLPISPWGWLQSGGQPLPECHGLSQPQCSALGLGLWFCLQNQHLGACRKCRFPGLVPDLLGQNLPFNRILVGQHAVESFRSLGLHLPVRITQGAVIAYRCQSQVVEGGAWESVFLKSSTTRF